ncbi:NlpC/P60 family protein [Streptantibioticus parmotrematis]|uniref:NlpC/P60 family protein n=1 Tax=Streptantibioticus parmotrematis TaxID=2873249 RepID=UPI0033CDE61E
MASHRRPPQPGLVRAGRVTVLSAAAAAAAVTSALPAGAASHDSPADVRSKVEGLYEQAEQATQQFDAAREAEARLRGELDALHGESARTQQKVNDLRDSLGRVAGEQYRDGGIDPTLALLLTSDPGGYLDRAADLDRIASERAGQLRQLRAAQRVLDQERREAAGKLAELTRTRTELGAHKRTVLGKLGEARRLLGTLTAAQQASVGLGRADDGRTAFGGAVPDLPDLPAASGRAAEAVAAVRAALGMPYSWGSTGPTAFDCSGLMYWAYQHAGITLPRTSQEQLHAGQHVPLAEARPGDLVIYRGDASHVGMYVGGGKVIHAPYPGARVRYDPVNMLPVDAVVRP